jgi:hypothetical protein
VPLRSVRFPALTLIVLVARSLPGQTAANDTYRPLPAPSLVLGTEGNPDLEFTSISSAHRLSTGEFLVADGQGAVIRIFGPDGQLARKIGRQGAGPGEYRAVHSVYRAGDTLIIYDWHQRRLTRILPSGTVLGTQLVEPSTGGPVDLAGRLQDGRWLVTTVHAPSWSHGHGAYRDTLRVGTLDAATSGPVRWMSSAYPGMSLFAYMPSEDKSQWVVGMLPLAATTITRANGDTIYVGDTATDELQRWRPNGSALPPLRLPLPPEPDLQPLLDARRDEELAGPGAERQRRYILAAHEAKRVPPRYRDFVVASSGDIWIRLYERGPTDSTRYLVITPSGGVRARLSLAPRSGVVAVQAPWVFATAKNEDDVESLHVIEWTWR